MTLYPITSRPTVDFTAALAAASGSLAPPFTGSAITTLVGLPPWGSRRFVIRALSYTAVQNLGLAFAFFSAAAGGASFLSRYQFTKADAVQQNSTGLYTAYIDGLAIPYMDADTSGTTDPPTLHLALQNVDTVAKSSGSGGAVVVTVWLEPMDEQAG